MPSRQGSPYPPVKGLRALPLRAPRHTDFIITKKRCENRTAFFMDFYSVTTFALANFVSLILTASSIAPHTAVESRAIVTPTVAISCSITAVLSGDDVAVRNGKNGTTSPCHKCSKASSIEPPPEQVAKP